MELTKEERIEELELEKRKLVSLLQQFEYDYDYEPNGYATELLNAILTVSKN